LTLTDLEYIINANEIVFSKEERAIMRTLLLLLIISYVFVAAPTAAREGLYLGVFALYTDISHARHDSADYLYINSLDGGGGLGFRVGYGLTEHVALEWTLERTWHSTNRKTVRESR
jgi:hypothetical protein